MNPLRVLFLASRPDLRSVVLGALLRSRGWRVELACALDGRWPHLADGFEQVHALEDLAGAGDLARDFDLLVCRAFGTDHGRARNWGRPWILDLAGAARPEDIAVGRGPAAVLTAGSAPVGPGLAVPQGLLRAHLPVKLSPRDSRDGRLRAALLSGFGPDDAAGLGNEAARLADLGFIVNIYCRQERDAELVRAAGLDPGACHCPAGLRELVAALSRNDLGLVCGAAGAGTGPGGEGPSARAVLFLAAGLPLVVREGLPDAAFLGRVPAGAVYAGTEDLARALDLARQAGRLHEIRNFAPLLDSLGQELEACCRKAVQGEAVVRAGGTVAARALALDGGASRGLRAEPDFGEISLRARRAMMRLTEPVRRVPPQALAALETLVAAAGVRDAVDLGIAGSPAAPRLLEQGLLLLGLDLEETPSCPGLRTMAAPYWEQPPADLVYALDLLPLLSEERIRRTLDAAAQAAPLFFASVATAARGTLEAECLDTLRPAAWWHHELLQRFAQVTAGSEGPGLWLSARAGLEPVLLPGRMRGYRDWNAVTGLPVTHYREYWNRHARSLPWTGRMLYIGSNPLCRSYYHAEFFQAAEVLHVDPDPKNGADLVAVGEDLGPVADASVDGVAFFGTPYVMNDPAAFVAEARRVLKPGGLFSGAFNGPAARWDGRPYTVGAVKDSGEQWIFELGPVLELFQGFDLRCTARMGHEYFFVTATREGVS